ncbi:MAG TPA: pilus assembly protein, partial [Acetobacteraceae bacterium]|nr:pilus assembly protein [Acetobacteraceae bacterium]
MPPDGTVIATLPAAETDQPDRLDRSRIIAFVGNQETEAALREGLLEAVPQGFEIRRGTVRVAIAALQKMPTPHTLIVDVSGEDQPLSALGGLSSVVEPDVRVLVIGDRDDLNFYRQVTRGLGALEYLYQPLMRDMVARHFGPHILQRA